MVGLAIRAWAGGFASKHLLFFSGCFPFDRRPHNTTPSEPVVRKSLPGEHRFSNAVFTPVDVMEPPNRFLNAFDERCFHVGAICHQQKTFLHSPRLEHQQTKHTPGRIVQEKKKPPATRSAFGVNQFISLRRFQLCVCVRR